MRLMRMIGWHARRLALRADPVLLASVAVIAAAALLHWGVTVPGTRTLAVQRAEQDGAQLRQARAARADNGQAQEQARLARLLERFPAADNRNVSAAVILVQALAAEQGLAAEKGNYQLSGDGIGGVARYTISLPVKGSYPAVRDLLRKVQHDLPHVVLDSVQISRPGKADPTVEAQLQFSAYFRRSP